MGWCVLHFLLEAGSKLKRAPCEEEHHGGSWAVPEDVEGTGSFQNGTSGVFIADTQCILNNRLWAFHFS